MTTREQKKHDCQDCKQCQQCSETRCRSCRGQGAEAGERRFAALSMAQQIALFESVNASQAPEGDYSTPKQPPEKQAASFQPISELTSPASLPKQ